jgi:hypothetical protein
MRERREDLVEIRELPPRVTPTQAR